MAANIKYTQPRFQRTIMRPVSVASMSDILKFLLAAVCLVPVFILAVNLPVGHQDEAAQKDECDSHPLFTQIVKQQINSMGRDVDRIIDEILHGKEKHTTYDELALFCDKFGPRLSGSDSLAKAIDYMKNKMRNQSRLDVKAEKAMIPKWEVLRQDAEMIEPRRHKMSIMTLGGSVSTVGELTGEVQLVHSFDELKRLGSEVAGKIVVFNYNFTTYGESVKFRTQGAKEAARWGASAALVRSVTPYSIYSPHAGMATKSIPTAAITVEDAELIERIIRRGQKVWIHMAIETKSYDDVESYNLVGDIVGSERPEHVVLVSGHIDSWYNTDGAMDDGGGMMISYKALDVLRKLNMTAKRTMRAVLWTSEEFGLIGAQQYFKDHRHELDNFKAVIESDEGTFTPLGLGYKNVGRLGRCTLRHMLKLTKRLHTHRLSDNYEGSDIELFSDVGVPGLSLLNENSKYFYYHHTAGDSITVEDPDALDRSTALFASTLYVLANLDINLRD